MKADLPPPPLKEERERDSHLRSLRACKCAYSNQMFSDQVPIREIALRPSQIFSQQGQIVRGSRSTLGFVKIGCLVPGTVSGGFFLSFFRYAEMNM